MSESLSKQEVPIKPTEELKPAAIAVANFLRDNKTLKQRTGLLNNTNDIEFFKFKRLSRALLSEEYKQKQAKEGSNLVPVDDEKDVNKVFIMLIQNQMVLPVEKLHYHEVKQTNRSWKPQRNKPTLKPTNKANLEPNAYFCWLYQKQNPFMLLYSVLLLLAVFTVILFPLWPNFMKIGVWYLSMAMLGLLGLFFGLAIVRLIIYIFSLVALTHPFWLFPNLFEDCGVIESFKPAYAWEKPSSKKSKKSNSKKPLQGSSDPSAESTANPTKSTAASTATDNSQTTPAPRGKVTLEEVDD